MPFTPYDLKCNDLREPIGVSAKRLRLSWKVKSDEPGCLQSGYQIQALSPSGTIIWDTGQVASEETVDIPWGGPELGSVIEVTWRVRVTKRGGGEASPWVSSRFVTGPQTPEDWRAAWIGSKPLKSSSETMGLEKASWLILPGEKATGKAVKRWFRVWIDENQTKGRLVFSADDACRVIWKGVKVAETSTWRHAKSVDLMVEGDDWLVFEVDNADGQIGLIAALTFNDKTVASDKNWEASADQKEWLKAEEAGPYGCQPWGKIPLQAPDQWGPAPVLNKTFRCERKPKKAYLFASALGVMDWELNGQGPKLDVLYPGWTDFNKRVHYVGWEVTDLLEAAQNSLTVTLGDGWYAGYLAFSGRRAYYGANPQALLSLWMQDDSGQWEVLGSDGTWQAGEGPVRENDLLMGSVLDTTHPVAFTRQAVETSLKQAQVPVLPHPAGAIEVTQKVAALTVTKDDKGRWICDFGQNLVGVVSLKVTGKAGQKLTLRHAEVLEKDGNLYVTNLRAAKATDTIVLNGRAQEVHAPFTFHGFRFCEISGLDGDLSKDQVDALVFHTPMEKTGRFLSSNSLLNKLAENSDWSLRGNGLDVLTDCPQRDERAGWTGDIGVFVYAGMAHRAITPILSKFLDDLMADSQFPDGSLADVAPYVSVVGHGNPGWEDAGVILMAALAAEERAGFILDEHRQAAVRFGNYLKAELMATGLRKAGAYGDWLRLKGPQHSVLLATLYAAHSYRCISVIDQAQADQWSKQADIAEDAVCRAFLKPDGRLVEQDQESQSFYAMAHFMKDPRLKETAKNLQRLVKESGGSLQTGFMGTGFLLQALAEQGAEDLMYGILLREEYPGWLYQIKNGATSMWERWDSWTPEKGFQDPGMNSFNHFWIGCVYDPMVRLVAGVSVRGRKGLIAPIPTKRMTHASARRENRHGFIEAGWAWEGSSLVLEGTVGPNMTAEVKVPRGFKGEDQTLNPGTYRIVLQEEG